MTPNSNGGLFSALAPHLATLRSRGVKYVQASSVDNLLCCAVDAPILGMVIDEVGLVTQLFGRPIDYSNAAI